ncbi:SGNH/GDSL hydrolase family protein [Globicatella sanguinis]|uniref:SGNH/GDSL hydrolase family protein n=1 Tax=Globicatella sanguinis TaxID=13076 RepID=UPI0008240321|nr:hypothetical protein [Globicatella sanguinis]
MSQELIDSYALESSNLQLLGTRGSDGNYHEGRGGWTTSLYRTNQIYYGSGNPFFNPDKNDFDFAYYMAQNGYSGLTDVIFQLGINDVFGLENDNLMSGIIKTITDYEALVQSVRAYDLNIQIGITVTIPPNASQLAFAKAYKTGQTQWMYKRNNAVWINQLIEHFKGRESENIRLIGQNACIDTKTRIADGVHPTVEGYQELGRVVYAYLKNN